MNAIIEAAHKAAHRIEEAAAESGTTYSACQSFYGVEFEALVGEDWIRACDLDLQEELDATAIRLYDCDGTRGDVCKTVAEIEAEANIWIEQL